MRIGIIGNMNNMSYVLMRYLNDMNYDTDLLLLGEGNAHFEPVADTYSNQYFDKIIQTRWVDRKLINVSGKEIKTLLNNYDVLIGTDYAPAFCEKIGRPLDVFIPHGSDLFYSPFIKIKLYKTLYDYYKVFLAPIQKKGIKRAKYILFNTTNAENEAYVEKLEYTGQRVRLTPPLLYQPQYDDRTPFRSIGFYKEICALKKTFDKVIFHHSSHQWKNNLYSLSYKANHMVIEGFKASLEKNKNNVLVLLEYGPDIENSKLLIRKLGIEKSVYWSKKLLRKDLMAGLSLADIGVGEIGHSWLTYGVICEFMTFAIPVIHNRNNDLYESENLYPMHSAQNSEDVCNGIVNYKENEYHQMGSETHAWYLDYCINKPLDFFKGILK